MKSTVWQTSTRQNSSLLLMSVQCRHIEWLFRWLVKDIVNSRRYIYYEKTNFVLHFRKKIPFVHRFTATFYSLKDVLQYLHKVFREMVTAGEILRTSGSVFRLDFIFGFYGTRTVNLRLHFKCNRMGTYYVGLSPWFVRLISSVIMFTKKLNWI